MERSGWFKAAAVLVTLSAAIFLFGVFGRVWAFLGDLILTIFFAWLIASILIHFVNNLMRVPHMTRPFAIVVVYVGLIALLADAGFLLIPATVDQVSEIASELPTILERVPSLIENANAFLVRVGVDINLLEQYQVDSFDAIVERWSAVLAENAAQIASGIFSALFNIALAIVLSFYFVLDGGRRIDQALKVLPPTWERESRLILRIFDNTFHGYIRGLLVVSLIYGIGTATIMLVMDLPAALPVAIISGLLLALPFLGDWLALALPLIVAGYYGNLVTFVVVLVTLLFIQQVMLNLLTPRILGNAVSMPAMMVIISLVLGARLAGIWGALLGVPTAGVIYSIAVTYGTRVRERREEKLAAEALHAAEVLGAPQREAFELPADVQEETQQQRPLTDFTLPEPPDDLPEWDNGQPAPRWAYAFPEDASPSPQNEQPSESEEPDPTMDTEWETPREAPASG
jgi:predicted PurR-regulated permease PerM